MNTQTEFSWKAPRFENNVENKIIQIGLFALSIILTFVLYYYGNKMLAFIVFFGMLLITIQKNYESKTLDILINKEGIKIDNEELLYKNILAFWIFKGKDNVDYLLLRHKKDMLNSTRIFIITEDVNIKELREFLKDFVTEKKIKEPIYERLVNRV